MLKQPMIEKLVALRLLGMAEALKTQEQDAASRELSFLERLAMLVDQQWNWRENQALAAEAKATVERFMGTLLAISVCRFVLCMPFVRALKTMLLPIASGIVNGSV
jgi:hypothetical protein